MRLIFIFLFLILQTVVVGQSLSLADLRYLLNNDVEKSDTYIAKKGFEFFKTEPKNENSCQSMTWAIKRNESSDYANAFLRKTCFEGGKGSVYFQFSERVFLDKIKEQANFLKFKFVNSETNLEGALCSIYENITERIFFCSGINLSTNKNQYTILIFKKEEKRVFSGGKIQWDVKCLLKGIVKKEMYYGPPSFGEDSLNDKKEYHFILYLDKPIQVPDQNSDIEEWIEIDKIHIIPIANYDLDIYIDSKIEILCTLDGANTAHHRARAITVDIFRIGKLN